MLSGRMGSMITDSHPMVMPSEDSFRRTTVEDESVISMLKPFMNEHINDEFKAALLVHGARNGLSVEKLQDLSDLDESDSRIVFQRLLYDFNGTDYRTSENLYYWIDAMNFGEFSPYYFAALFVVFGGEGMINLANLARKSKHIPEIIPIRTFENFRKTKTQLREEGVTIHTPTLLALCHYWTTEEILQFFVEGETDYEMILQIRNSGAEEAEEILDFMENLPAEWLNEFFS